MFVIGKRLLSLILSLVIIVSNILFVYATNVVESGFYGEFSIDDLGYLISDMKAVESIRNEYKIYSNPNGGHGFAAEKANNLIEDYSNNTVFSSSLSNRFYSCTR